MQMDTAIFIYLLVLIGFFWITILIIRGLINCAKNMPTWKGIILSAIFGVLPFYLIMCFFGWAGEPREDNN